MTGIGQRHVCHECIDDAALRTYIQDHATETSCYYCRRESEDPIAVELGVLATFVEESLRTEYEDPINWVPYESAEGGYLLPPWTTRDLLGSELGLEVSADNLLDDLSACISVELWYSKNPPGLEPHEMFKYSWNRFATEVKYRRRFTLAATPDSTSFWAHEIPPSEMLQSIGDTVINAVGAVRALAEGHIIWRARSHEPNECLRTAAQLGPPLPGHAKKASRMSPPGIPMFYGAGDARTAIREVTASTGQPETVTVGCFKLQRPLVVIDLVNLPPLLSIFDKAGRGQRWARLFLDDFVAEVSKDIEKDGEQNIEYVPTQMMTEYFRYTFRDEHGRRVEGLLYPSSLPEGRVNYALFLEQEDCADDCDCARPASATLLLLHEATRRYSVDIGGQIVNLDLPDQPTGRDGGRI